MVSSKLQKEELDGVDAADREDLCLAINAGADIPDVTDVGGLEDDGDEMEDLGVRGGDTDVVVVTLVRTILAVVIAGNSSV